MDKKLFRNTLDWLVDDLDEDTCKRVADAIFDVVENKVAESKNKIDDRLILPAIGLMRKSFDVPDNDREVDG